MHCDAWLVGYLECIVPFIRNLKQTTALRVVPDVNEHNHPKTLQEKCPDAINLELLQLVMHTIVSSRHHDMIH